MTIQVGTSGWSNDRRQGNLYLHGDSSLARLDHYARRFGTVEVKSTS
jgi:uncharacterized protein YecE (DUF72 family)